MTTINIATEIGRIASAKSAISEKGVELGISLEGDLIDEIATKFESQLIYRGAVSQTIMGGESIVIARGYHNGEGTISAVSNSGGEDGDYTLQSKTATPTKTSQTVVADSEYYGLSLVTVAPIPNNFQDVSAVTADSSDVLEGKTILTQSGEVEGAMVNNGNIAILIDGLTSTSATVPTGYTSGGTVSITTSIENRLATI
ncbi:MAG: hypothetical protein R3Y08_01485 [Rikenellaceae bacterium]